MVLPEQQGSSVPDISMLARQDGCGQDPLYAATPHRPPVAWHPRLHGPLLLPPLILRFLHSPQRAGLELSLYLDDCFCPLGYDKLSG